MDFWITQMGLHICRPVRDGFMININREMNKLLVILSCSLLVACTAQRGTQSVINKSADRLLFKDSTIGNAHIGISIFDPATNKYLYNYQGNKYFVPASNTKIFSCYTALKYLGDSVPGLQYIAQGDTVY